MKKQHEIPADAHVLRLDVYYYEDGIVEAYLKYSIGEKVESIGFSAEEEDDGFWEQVDALEKRYQKRAILQRGD